MGSPSAARGLWSVRTGSVTGSAHLRQAAGCQDAYVVDQVGGALLVAVADGCSGARRSALGAALAASLATAAARDLLVSFQPPGSAEVWQAFLAALRDRVLDGFAAAAGPLAAMVDGGNPGDLATTLVTVVASPPWVAVLAVGDGSVFVRSTDAHLDLLVAPDGRSDDSSHTVFVTTPGIREHALLRVAEIHDLDAFAVCTDGLDESCIEFDGKTALRPSAAFFQPLFAWAADRRTAEVNLLRRLLDEDVQDTSEDDRTIVLAVLAR